VGYFRGEADGGEPTSRNGPVGFFASGGLGSPRRALGLRAGEMAAKYGVPLEDAEARLRRMGVAEAPVRRVRGHRCGQA
jgi:hypothetical protein